MEVAPVSARPADAGGVKGQVDAQAAARRYAACCRRLGQPGDVHQAIVGDGKEAERRAGGEVAQEVRHPGRYVHHPQVPLARQVFVGRQVEHAGVVVKVQGSIPQIETEGAHQDTHTRRRIDVQQDVLLGIHAVHLAVGADGAVGGELRVGDLPDLGPGPVVRVEGPQV